MAARSIRRVEVLVNESLAGVMDIEMDGLSPREHVTFTYADSWMSAAEAFEVSRSYPCDAAPSVPPRAASCSVPSRMPPRMTGAEAVIRRPRAARDRPSVR